METEWILGRFCLLEICIIHNKLSVFSFLFHLKDYVCYGNRGHFCIQHMKKYRIHPKPSFPSVHLFPCFYYYYIFFLFYRPAVITPTSSARGIQARNDYNRNKNVHWDLQPIQ